MRQRQVLIKVLLVVHVQILVLLILVLPMLLLPRRIQNLVGVRAASGLINEEATLAEFGGVVVVLQEAALRVPIHNYWRLYSHRWPFFDRVAEDH